MVLVVILVAFLLIGGLAVILQGGEDEVDYPLPVTDSAGREVVIESVPEKIVSAAPATTELLYSLGVGDRVVGVTDYCDYPTRMVENKTAGNITSIGGYEEPSMETIIDLDPDLVVLSGDVDFHQDIADTLDDMNIKSLISYRGDNITQIYQNLRMIGEVCDHVEVADDLISDMQDRISSVTERISGTGEVSVMHTIWMDPVYTPGNDTFAARIIGMAGGEILFDDLSGWPTVSKEEVVDRQPEVMTVTATHFHMSPEEVIDFLKEDPMWSQLPAVKNDRVYILVDQAENIFNRQTVRIVDAIELTAEILHPDAFEVTPPNIIGNDYQEYLESQV
ncbi:MAG: ABC transporter substrate-binding protein [Methanomassiliicoccales archaeon]